LRYKNSVEEFEDVEEERDEEEDSEEEEDQESEEEIKEDETMREATDGNVRIIPLKFFKYWPTKELRQSWRNYIFLEVDNCENLAALSIAVRILERINNEFLQR